MVGTGPTVLTPEGPWGSRRQLRQLNKPPWSSFQAPCSLAAPRAGGHSRPRVGLCPLVEVAAAPHPSSWVPWASVWQTLGRGRGLVAPDRGSDPALRPGSAAFTLGPSECSFCSLASVSPSVKWAEMPPSCHRTNKGSRCQKPRKLRCKVGTGLGKP